MLVISHDPLKTQLHIIKSSDDFICKVELLDVWDESDRPQSLSSSEALKLILDIRNTRRNCHFIFITDFIGFQSLQRNLMFLFLVNYCDNSVKYWTHIFL